MRESESYNDVTDKRIGTLGPTLSSSPARTSARSGILQWGSGCPLMGSAAARLSWGLGTLMVAIKSEEIEGRVATTMMAFTIGEEVIMEE